MPKEITLEELQKQFEEYKKQKEEEVKVLTDKVEDANRKLLSFSISGVTKKVETIKEKEPVDFDFDI